MSGHVITEALDKIAGGVSLFERSRDLDRFLRQSASYLVDQTGVARAAVFGHDERTGDLVFRAGVDRGDYWDDVHAGRKEPPRFDPDGTEVGRAFAEGRVLVLEYDEVTDDHPFRSKLIIPISRGQVRIGVLILASFENGVFGDESEADLMAAASRLGDLLEDASVLLEAKELRNRQGRTIEGKKASAGVVLGTALPFWADLETAASGASPAGNPGEELGRFDAALALSMEQLDEIRERSSAETSELVAMIFLSHQLMLKDVSFTDKMRTRIQEGESAALSVRAVVEEYAAVFSSMQEVRFAEKAQDVRDLGYRLLTNLSGGHGEEFSYRGRIALARHIYPSDLFRLSVEGVGGVVLLGGGVTAHIAILARSLDLPVMITDDATLLEIPAAIPLFLDAGAGRLYVDPQPDLLEEYQPRLGAKVETHRTYMIRGATADGVRVRVAANVNILKDARDALGSGAEGIGLYRSEFPFILRNDFLSEEQQTRIYRSIVQSQPGRSVILRTADIGGDKLFQGRGEAESNPFLGVRGIRFSLANREMFREQLRAMLRAGDGANLGIMLPMVSGVEEIIEAKAEIGIAMEKLETRGISYNRDPRIGAMVELPSAAMAVKELAAETDFLSIGTNDLTMYLLAVDRTNEEVGHLYTHHHPTVIQVLAQIARDAEDSGTDLSICGDAGADPALVPFFVGIGIRTLSVSPSNVERVKRRIAQFTLKEAQTAARELLDIRRLDKMARHLARFMERHPAPDFS